jgi:hypothetical protein
VHDYLTNYAFLLFLQADWRWARRAFLLKHERPGRITANEATSFNDKTDIAHLAEGDLISGRLFPNDTQRIMTDQHASVTTVNDNNVIVTSLAHPRTLAMMPAAACVTSAHVYDVQAGTSWTLGRDSGRGSSGYGRQYGTRTGDLRTKIQQDGYLNSSTGTSDHNNEETLIVRPVRRRAYMEGNGGITSSIQIIPQDVLQIFEYVSSIRIRGDTNGRLCKFANCFIFFWKIGALIDVAFSKIGGVYPLVTSFNCEFWIFSKDFFHP